MKSQNSKSPAAPKGQPLKPIELFAIGKDKAGKPIGARFPAGSDQILIAVMDMGLRCIFPASEAFSKLGQRLPAGRVYSSGKAFIPNIKQSVYEELWQASEQPSEQGGVHGPGDPSAGSQVEQNNAVTCVSPTIAGLPRDWASVGIGHMVLIQASPEDGWWEAVIQARDQDVLTLRYRDYPKEQPFVRHVSAVALVNPGLT